MFRPVRGDHLEAALDLADQCQALEADRDRWRSVADRLAAAISSPTWGNTLSEALAVYREAVG